MYFDDSNIPKCSSHLCCTGYNFASHSLLTSSLHIHTVTLKYVCASAASYPNNVYDYPSFIRYCTGSQTIVACLVPPCLCSHLRRVYMCMFIIIFPRNVSFRGYYVFDSNAAAAAAAPPPPRRRRPPHYFVVSAITFEGFKLRSSNLTHALFIQISRTSSITDIVVQSKMAAILSKKFQKKKKLRIDLKWQEL